MPNWTDEQLRAIEARGGDILLSAAAGSGKTTVLVERVLRLITGEGADLERMLVVTFTRAAASDMRAKLASGIAARAAAGDARCRDQLLKLESAGISTLHAFCSDFLRTHFESAGVDPAFRVLDDALDARLRDEALDAALEEAYAGGGEALLSLDYGRGPAGVRAAAEVLLRRMEDRPDPEAWLEDIARCDEPRLQAWQDELKDDARRCLHAARVHLTHALSLSGCPQNFESAMRLDVAALDDMIAIEDYDGLYRALTEFEPASARGRRGEGADPETAETVKGLRDAAKNAREAARLTDLPLLQARADAAALSGQLKTLSGIARRAAALYEAAKAEQSGLTYADLEHRTLRALQNPSVARAMRERYDYIFVDEYQDTSDLQEALVSAIRGQDNLFMVGDVKQSIYRFRRAEPRLFMDRYAAYARGDGGILLPLTRNFRSRKGILDFVNLVFERVMTGGDAEITYDELARLNPGLPQAEGGAEDVDILLIDASAAPGPEEAADEAEAAAQQMADIEREGVLIARTIRRMMAGDPSLSFRDFAILTRSKASAFPAMMPVLLAHGIPAYADGQAGYYESVEISWLMSMLRLIANGRSDVELIAVLRSPAVGLTADDLARIRIAHKTAAYVDAAAAYAAEADDDIARRLRAFFDQLSAWRLREGGVGLGEFVRTVLDESGFYIYAGALPGGAQRQANLDRFVVEASGFDDEYSGSLTRFLAYTEHLRQKGDGDAAHLLGENDNVVRLMSVHKSKGLEFRVVFGAQLAKKYHAENTGTPLLTHRDLGAGMSYYDPELRTRRMTLPQAAIMARQQREDAAEEMRILYVMLTRARERLVLVGTVKGAEKAMKRWQALSAAPFAASSHLDLIMAARCGAEAQGAALRSRLTLVPAASVRPESPEGATDARALFDRVMADPASFADEKLEAQMTWRYPDPLAADKPLKLTASGLLREIEGPQVLPPLAERPAFLSEDARRMTGAERGTAYHRCMQLLALDALSGLSGRALKDAVARQLDDFTDRRLLEEAQRDAVQPARLVRFLESDIGLRLRRAQRVRREWPFNVMLKAAEALTPDEAGRFGDEELLVQGTIDCCFVEDGQWVLLDYKTDRTDDMDALRAHYEKQLNVYALALERITGMKVKQRTLCLLHSGGTVEV